MTVTRSPEEDDDDEAGSSSGIGNSEVLARGEGGGEGRKVERKYERVFIRGGEGGRERVGGNPRDREARGRKGFGAGSDRDP